MRQTYPEFQPIFRNILFPFMPIEMYLLNPPKVLRGPRWWCFLPPNRWCIPPDLRRTAPRGPLGDMLWKRAKCSCGSNVVRVRSRRVRNSGVCVCGRLLGFGSVQFRQPSTATPNTRSWRKGSSILRQSNKRFQKSSTEFAIGLCLLLQQRKVPKVCVLCVPVFLVSFLLRGEKEEMVQRCF
jgi:hypothetical protein